MLDAQPTEPTDETYRVSAAEFRAFIQRIERIDTEISDLRTMQKEVYDEAKSRGYMTGPMRKLVAERRRDPSAVAEESALLDMYREVMG